MTQARPILAIPEGVSLAHVLRPLAVAKELRRQGYEIVFACGGPHRDFIRAEGFRVEEIATREPGPFYARMRRARVAFDADTVARYVRAEIRLLHRVRPVLVIGDFRNTLRISTELLGIPYAAILNGHWVCGYSGRRRCPGFSAAPRLLGQRLATKLFLRVEPFVLRKHAEPFNACRRAVGLAPVENVLDLMCSADLNLIADLPSFSPIRDLPDNFRYVGPLCDGDSRLFPAPEWLDEIDPERPTIYLTGGSTGAPEMWKIARKAFGGTSWQALATVGNNRLDGDWPANFRAAGFADGLALAEKSDVVVCHGGAGTVYQAILSGVPILALPTFHDQEYVAERLEELGLGERLSPRTLSPQSLLLAAERWARRAPEVKTAGERLRREAAACNGATTAARYVIEMLENQGWATTDTLLPPEARVVVGHARLVQEAEPGRPPNRREGMENMAAKLRQREFHVKLEVKA